MIEHNSSELGPYGPDEIPALRQFITQKGGYP